MRPITDLQDALLSWLEQSPITAADLTRKLYRDPQHQHFVSVRRAAQRLARRGLVVTWKAPNPAAVACAVAEKLRRARGMPMQQREAHASAGKSVVWIALP